MIISKQKSFDSILSSIKKKPVFIIGCTECATLCHSGGEDEVLIMKKDLENHDVPVSGWVILDPACHFFKSKKLLKPHEGEIQAAGTILVLACGNGVQTVAELIDDTPVLSGTDTLFLGEIKRINQFEKRCNLCGNCIVDSFAGLCPLTRCPKRMLNGPCGGSFHGFCEVDKNMPCVWDEIIKKQEKMGYIKISCEIVPPQDWSKSVQMKVGDEG